MLIAVPLIVTMAVGLIVGIRLVSEKNATLRLSNTGQGTANSTPAAPATPAPAASPSVTPSPTTAATPTPTATPTTAATNMSRVLIGPASTANAASRSGATVLVARVLVARVLVARVLVARVLVDGVLVDRAGAATAALGNATQQTRQRRRWDGRSGQPSRRPGPRRDQAQTSGWTAAPMGG
jgi:hypothetical protein